MRLQTRFAVGRGSARIIRERNQIIGMSVMTKHDVLTLLAQEAELDGLAVADRLSSSVEAAGMLLLRLFRHGLLKRGINAVHEHSSKVSTRLNHAFHLYERCRRGNARFS